MHVGTRRDVPPRYADHRTVLVHGCTLGDGVYRDLVARRDIVHRGDHAVGGLDERSPADVVADEPDVVHPVLRDQRHNDACRLR
jgi:hypothetical protein